MTFISEFNPKVSIIIPVYNGSNYLEKSILSALNQSFINIEVIVVNDGSKDGGDTERIALSFGDKIRYYTKPNGGVSSALNLGIKHMNGLYFSWLSHDDLYDKDKISAQIGVINSLANKETIVYSAYNLINSDGKKLYSVRPDILNDIRRLNTPLYPLFKGLVNGCTLLIHNNLFKKFGVFDETLLSTQDYDLWLKIFKGVEVYYLPRTLVSTRIHVNQSSNINPARESETNQLWIKMIESLTEMEIKQIQRNRLDLYLSMLGFSKSMKLNILEDHLTIKIKLLKPRKIHIVRYHYYKSVEFLNNLTGLLANIEKITISLGWLYGIYQREKLKDFIRKLLPIF